MLQTCSQEGLLTSSYVIRDYHPLTLAPFSWHNC